MGAFGLSHGALWVGLTGGIGSGKSTVAALLAGHGSAVVDTDLIARQLTLPGGRAIAAIAAAFGGGMIDANGALNRPRMREIVFADPQEKHRLEAILHPLIALEANMQAGAATAAVIVFDVPLLVESGERWRARVNKVLVVDCRETMQVERVVARSAWTPDAVRAVIDQQASRERRRAFADAVIHNDGITSLQLAAQVASLWRHWQTDRVAAD